MEFGIGHHLAPVSTNLLAGMIEAIAAAPYNGHADLPELANDLQLEIDDLFPITEALQILGFVELGNGDVFLTEPGKAFFNSDTQARKKIFAEQLIQNVPLAAHIRNVLNERPSHRAPRIRFEPELEDYLIESYADETLDAVIKWGRYAELYSYDDQSEIFSLDNP